MPPDRFLDPRMSAWLDLLRAASALAVLVGHVGQLGFFGQGWPQTDTLQHAAVIVFFVLSGLLIRQSACRESMTLAAFAKARAIRILPVSIVALLFSTTVAFALQPLAKHDPYLPPFDTATVKELLVASLFLNERSAGFEPILNPPYWSLCYEVWFYALFAAWAFLRGYRRIIAVTLIAWVAGLPVLLLLPTWLVGAWVGTNWSWLRRVPPLAALAAAVAGFVLISAPQTAEALATYTSERGIHLGNLHFSEHFITDLPAGLFVALAIVALKSSRLTLNAATASIARWGAGLSFTLYLTHWPILIAIRTVADRDALPYIASLALVLPLSFAALVAPLIERRLPIRLRSPSLDAARAAMASRWPTVGANADARS